MKYSFLLILTLFPIKSFGDGNPIELQKGDCFEYIQEVKNPKLAWVVGRIEDLNLGTWDLEGTLYGRKKIKNNKEPYVTFNFALSYKGRARYKKIECPKDLPIIKK
jgi:hypothetical protein